jgi:hypothetical protein
MHLPFSRQFGNLSSRDGSRMLYDRFGRPSSDKQKQELIKHHSKTLEIESS